MSLGMISKSWAEISLLSQPDECVEPHTCTNALDGTFSLISEQCF